MRVGPQPLGRRGDPDLIEQGDRALTRFALRDPSLQRQRFGHLVPDGEDRVQGAHRILEDHRDLPAAHLPQVPVAKLQEVAPLEQRLAAEHGPGLAARDRARPGT